MVDLHYILLKINNAEDFDLEYVHQNTSYGTINRDFLKKRKEIQTRLFNRDSTLSCKKTQIQVFFEKKVKFYRYLANCLTFIVKIH